jgi:hypothetical protein
MDSRLTGWPPHGCRNSRCETSPYAQVGRLWIIQLSLVSIRRVGRRGTLAGWEWHAELAGAALVPTLVKPEQRILVGHESGVGGDDTNLHEAPASASYGLALPPHMRQRWRHLMTVWSERSNDHG